MINFRKIIVCIATCILIYSADIFSNTDGLIDINGDFYVKELLSSGSDDNICIEFSKILFIPFFIFLFTLKRRFALWELLTGNAVLLIQLILLFAIESGSIIKTIGLGNWSLALWLFSYISLSVEVNLFFFYEKKYDAKKGVYK